MRQKRKDKLHYVGVRERWVKIVTTLINEGVEQSGSSLAKSIGVDVTQVNRIVKIVRDKSDAKECPTINMIVETCLRYNCSMEWVMSGRGHMRLPESEKQRLNRLDKEMDQLLEIITHSHK